jgi:hypothetical protein
MGKGAVDGGKGERGGREKAHAPLVVFFVERNRV